MSTTTTKQHYRELKEIEHLLKFKEQSAFIERIAALSPDLINVYDFPSGKHVYINRDITELQGGSKTNLNLVSFEDRITLIHPDDRERTLTFLEQIRNAGDEDVIEYVYRMGTPLKWNWFCARAIVFQRNEQGEVTQYLSLSRDISLHKEAEERIKENEYFLRELFYSNPDFVQVYDFTLEKIVFTNYNIFEKLGYSDDNVNLPQEEFKVLRHPDDERKIHDFRNFFLTANDEDIKEIEIRIKSAANEWKWYRTRGKVFRRDENGNVTQYLSVSQDITNEKQAIQEQRMAFRVLDTMESACYEIDMNGIVQFVNRKASELWNIPKEKIIGHNIWSLFPQAVNQYSYTTIQKTALEQRKYAHAEFVSPVFGRWISLSATPVETGVIVVFTEIDELKKTRQKLNESQLQLQKVFESSINSIMLLKSVRNENNRITDFNLQYCNTITQDFFGEDQISKANFKFRNTEIGNKPEIIEALSQCVDQNTSVDFEFQCYAKWIRIRAVKLDDGVVVVLEDITSRKRNELKLQEKNDLLESVMNAPNVRIQVFKPVLNPQNEVEDFEWIFLSRETEKLLGRNDLIGKTLNKEFPFSALQLENLKRVYNTGESLSYEYNSPNGSWFRVNLSKQNNMIIRLWDDITDRKKAELEAKERKKILQSVFNATRSAFIVFKVVYDRQREISDLKYLLLNEIALRNYFGNQDPTGQTYWENIPEMFNSEMFGKFKSVMITNDFLDLEVKIEKENYFKWFRITASRMDDLLVTSTEDITKSKISYEEIKESKHFIEALTIASSEIINIFDFNQNKYIYSNYEITDLFDHPTEEIADDFEKRLNYLVHPEDHSRLREYHQNRRLLKDKEELAIDYRCRRSGEWQWFHSRSKIFKRNPDNSVAQLISFTRNINDSKIASLKLQEAEKLSLKGTIARTIAHEVRNPLTNIFLSSDLIRRILGNKIEEYPSITSSLDIINRNSKNIDHLIRELLAPSKLNLELAKIDLTTILNESILQSKDRLFLRNVTLVKNFEPGNYILGDAESLKIAFLNIIINAVEAMAEGNGRLTIGIINNNENILLTIEDNGCGMSADELEKMFQQFYTRKKTGLGIGLTNVYNILKEHNAKIEVRSEPGMGTTFSICFQSVLK